VCRTRSPTARAIIPQPPVWAAATHQPPTPNTDWPVVGLISRVSRQAAVSPSQEVTHQHHNQTDRDDERDGRKKRKRHVHVALQVTAVGPTSLECEGPRKSGIAPIRILRAMTARDSRLTSRAASILEAILRSGPGADGEIRTPGQRFTKWQDQCRRVPSRIATSRVGPPVAAALLVNLLVRTGVQATNGQPREPPEVW